eukprot:221102-Amphidinium_carterae.4
MTTATSGDLKKQTTVNNTQLKTQRNSLNHNKLLCLVHQRNHNNIINNSNSNNNATIHTGAQ